MADENEEIFREKGKFRKFSTESEKFSKIGGKSETGGTYIMASVGWTPLDVFSGRIIVKQTVIASC